MPASSSGGRGGLPIIPAALVAALVAGLVARQPDAN